MRPFFPLTKLNSAIGLAMFAAALSFSLPLAAQTAESAPTAAVTQNTTTSAAQIQLNQLMTDYYLAVAKFDPVNATAQGDNRFDDQIGMSISPQERNKQFNRYQQFLDKLHAISSDQLDSPNQINYAILDYYLKTALSYRSFPDHLLPIHQMDTMPIILANYASGGSDQPISTPQQYRAYLNRISQLPAWIDQAIVNMRQGMRSGVVQPKALLVSALPQYKNLVSATPEKSIYYTPITNLPASFSSADKQALSAAYRTVIASKLNPALARLATFLEKEYLPACRTSTGWSALPNGQKWYATYVADKTTTSMTPDQIHETGLKEVARIQAQFAVLGPKLGYNGPASGLPTWVAAQPQFYPYKTEQEILDVFNQLNVKLDSQLPALFSLIPKSKLEVRLEPELTRATASAHYSGPAVDGSRPGIFWAVVNDPKEYNSTGIDTLFLHEGRPGHHFQVALQMEMTLPEFRKFSWINAYGEGWALYSETLGKEMGLYDDPAQYFGHLNDEMLRAVRLVVDTGMHAQGWSRERSIQYMRDTLGYSEAEAKNATERYMAWPGQALGYKIGAMKIAQLRARASTALGDKFSLPTFHAIVLNDGQLPLSVLEAKVDRWIAQTSAVH